MEVDLSSLVIARPVHGIAIEVVLNEIGCRDGARREEARDVVVVGIDSATGGQVTLDIQDRELSRQHAVAEGQLLEEGLFRMRGGLLRLRGLLRFGRGRL
jgi:hypothetical protein